MSIAPIEELFEFMEDFDNEELLEDDRKDQLEEAVVEFNEQHETNYRRTQSFYQYESWKRRKNYTEQ